MAVRSPPPGKLSWRSSAFSVCNVDDGTPFGAKAEMSIKDCLLHHQIPFPSSQHSPSATTIPNQAQISLKLPYQGTQIHFKVNMQFTTIVAMLFASTAIATPAYMAERQVNICSGTYNNAQCCATDVLGLADLNCANRKITFTHR
jgi:hypothetical protein